MTGIRTQARWTACPPSSTPKVVVAAREIEIFKRV